jgi:hypothetical protein
LSLIMSLFSQCLTFGVQNVLDSSLEVKWH